MPKLHCCCGRWNQTGADKLHLPGSGFSVHLVNAIILHHAVRDF
jgi:hypothetical protein